MATTLEYRPFLDGVRAVAVLAVILYHLDLSWAGGGFLGVDVFFVLSGYLITSLLLREKAASGTIDLAGFYARRLKRLFPALLLLLLVLLTLGRKLYSPDSRYVIGRDAIAALAYVANWASVAFGQSYFESFLDPSPLRHMWSLSVEEQFYLCWPLLVLWLPQKRVRSAGVVALLALASAAALWLLYDPENPSRAYYGTDARIHQPLIGALAAMLRPPADSGFRWLRHAALPCALPVLACMHFVGDQQPAYYHGLSVAFSVVTALLLLGLDTADGGLLKGALSSRPMVWTGRISYGMYLWHWPVIVALGRTTLTSASARALITLTATFALSAASYHGLEARVRHARAWFGRPLAPRLVFGVTGALMMFVMIPFAWQLREGVPAWASTELTVSGAGGFRIGIIGDSTAKAMVHGYRKLAERHGMTVIDGAIGGCSLAGIYQLNEHGKPFTWSDRCAKAFLPTLKDVVAAKPNLVIWESRREVFGALDLTSKTPHVFGSPEHDRLLKQGWAAALRELKGIRVVIIGILHTGPNDWEGCASRPHWCADDGSDGKTAHLNELLRELADEYENVTFVSTAPLLCPSGPPCPRTAKGIVLRPDGNHYSEAAAEMTAQAVLEQLRVIH